MVCCVTWIWQMRRCVRGFEGGGIEGMRPSASDQGVESCRLRLLGKAELMLPLRAGYEV
jgi:hypothetical protein